jgi:co-chaperonin GroES (HSP10)
MARNTRFDNDDFVSKPANELLDSYSKKEKNTKSTVHTLNKDSMGVYSGLYCPNCGEKCKGYSGSFNIAYCATCGATMQKLPNPDNWANVNEMYMLSPILGGSGRLLILEDPFKSQFECTKCHGKGHLGVVCKWCLGTRFEKGKEENGYCRDCTVGAVGAGKTLGYEACDLCHGQGGSIVTPEESQKNTTTGNILAISSSGIEQVKVGDKVMFTNYTGHPFKFMRKDFRMVTEKDLLCLVKQLKSAVPGLNEDTFADLENTGTPHV